MKFQDLASLFRSNQISKPEFIKNALAYHQALFDYVSVVQSTDVKEIRIQPDGVSFVIGEDDICLYAPPGEARVAPLEIINFGCYEPEETQAMDILSAGARNILDIGANIGWYSVRFAKRMRQAHVYSFEPLPTSFKYLQRNIAANGVGDRVMTFNYGLSDNSGVVEFFIAPSSGTNASLINVSGSADATPVVGFTLTLDQWVANQGVVPDFIKCDVEGAELLVFRGGRNTLVTHKPVVFAELLRKWAKPFGYHPNDMLNYFDELGYCCFAIGAEGATPISVVTEETLETNYVFLHKESHVSLIDALARQL